MKEIHVDFGERIVLNKRADHCSIKIYPNPIIMTLLFLGIPFWLLTIFILPFALVKILVSVFFPVVFLIYYFHLFTIEIYSESIMKQFQIFKKTLFKWKIINDPKFKLTYQVDNSVNYGPYYYISFIDSQRKIKSLFEIDSLEDLERFKRTYNQLYPEHIFLEYHEGI